jgi:hypothetical protein
MTNINEVITEQNERKLIGAFLNRAKRWLAFAIRPGACFTSKPLDLAGSNTLMQ